MIFNFGRLKKKLINWNETIQFKSDTCYSQYCWNACIHFWHFEYQETNNFGWCVSALMRQVEDALNVHDSSHVCKEWVHNFVRDVICMFLYFIFDVSHFIH